MIERQTTTTGNNNNHNSQLVSPPAQELLVGAIGAVGLLICNRQTVRYDIIITTNQLNNQPTNQLTDDRNRRPVAVVVINHRAGLVAGQQVTGCRLIFRLSLLAPPLSLPLSALPPLPPPLHPTDLTTTW